MQNDKNVADIEAAKQEIIDILNTETFRMFVLTLPELQSEKIDAFEFRLNILNHLGVHFHVDLARAVQCYTYAKNEAIKCGITTEDAVKVRREIRPYANPVVENLSSAS